MRVLRAVFVALAFVVASATAAPLSSNDEPAADLLAIESAPYPTKTQPPMPYEFAWAVKDEASNNDYAHQEKNDGKVTTGSYRVLLPDGRTQIVTYTADENGYVATVRYEGNANYQQSQNSRPYSTNNKPSPAYSAAASVVEPVVRPPLEPVARPVSPLAPVPPVVVPLIALSDVTAPGQPVSVQSSSAIQGQGEVSASAVAISSSSF